MKKDWLVISQKGERSHVIPRNDAYEHDESIACHCHPEIDNQCIIHNAFDGREWKEMSSTLTSEL